MNNKHSEHPSSVALCGSTQVATSITANLCKYGISPDQADRWISKYNRQSIPIIHDDRFWELLVQIAQSTDRKDVESALQSSIKQKSNRLYSDFEDARFEIMLSGADLYETESQRLEFTALLDEQHSIHNFVAFVAYGLPSLINLAQNHKRKCRPKNTIRQHPQPRKVTKSVSEPTRRTVRRSVRIQERFKKASMESKAAVSGV